MTVRFRRKPVSRFRTLRVAALICCLALPASAVAYQVASSQQAGSISGHILTGAAHPVEGAAITLLNAETLIHKVTHSDASGAYVFSSLPAGQYLLLAFHPGYFAEYFHMVQQLTQGITVRAEQPAANADFKLTTAPPVTALRD